MFPQTTRDSARDDTDFLVNLTNDGWFGEGAEQWQQAAAGIFRAVENGLPLVRSCNNGVTCWIDPHGRVRQIFKDTTGRIYGPGWMTMDLPLPAERPAPTFYNRHGSDWFGWGLCSNSDNYSYDWKKCDAVCPQRMGISLFCFFCFKIIRDETSRIFSGVKL